MLKIAEGEKQDLLLHAWVDQRFEKEAGWAEESAPSDQVEVGVITCQAQLVVRGMEQALQVRAYRGASGSQERDFWEGCGGHQSPLGQQLTSPCSQDGGDTWVGTKNFLRSACQRRSFRNIHRHTSPKQRQGKNYIRRGDHQVSPDK